MRRAGRAASLPPRASNSGSLRPDVRRGAPALGSLAGGCPDDRDGRAMAARLGAAVGRALPPAVADKRQYAGSRRWRAAWTGRRHGAAAWPVPTGPESESSSPESGRKTHHKRRGLRILLRWLRQSLNSNGANSRKLRRHD
jgi:hypothetical protein